jgi:hypothetical protein
MQRYRLVEQLTSWPHRYRKDDFWLRPTTLSFLFSSPQGFTTECIELNHNVTGRQVLLTAQSFVFSATRQAREDAKGPTSRWNFRRRLLAPLSSRVLCIGQLLTSGDYATEGLSALSAEETFSLLDAVTAKIMTDEGGYRAVLFKDIARQGDTLGEELVRKGYTPLPVEPVMLMDLSTFTTFEDYLSALSSKYRVRYRRARSKLSGLTRRQLEEDEVLARLDSLYDLYKEVTRGADFNLTPLQPDYFAWLAGVADFRGYFNEAGELVGFTSGIANGSVYQAHYLGLRESYKYSHHLYHNMLYDLLADALAAGSTTLDYGRTAPEIKSSIGAVAHNYSSMLRLNSSPLNKLVPHFTPAVFAAKDWQPRNPFRDGPPRS